MFIIRDVKLKIDHKEADLIKKVNELCGIYSIAKKGRKPEAVIEIVKKSIDARKKPDIYYIYTIRVDYGQDEKQVIKHIKSNKKAIDKFVFNMPEEYKLLENGDLKLDKPPVIIGSGPCGMFAAYILAQKGFRPIIIERGEDVDNRRKTIEEYWNKGKLDSESNVQFGEGGAGTFSDGKLNTLTKDVNGRNSYVINTFYKFGASKDITVDAKPHIGTDKLREVVKNMRNEIISLGGQFMFDTKLIDIIFDEKNTSKMDEAYKQEENANEDIENKSIRKITLEHRKSGLIFELETDILILAIGHSARDTFEMLYEKGLYMEPKSFAVGFRVRHPQSDVNMWQYGVSNSHELGLEAADYKVTNEASNGRRVYSFCMCPGGYVVNSSSESGRICVNGMSEEARDSAYANSAIIAGIDPDDFVQDTVDIEHPLRGMYYQRNIEAAAYNKGKGYIPVQHFNDFENNRISDDSLLQITDDCMEGVKGGVQSANLRGIFSESIDEAIIESIHKFGYTRKGFDSDAVMLGIEGRTSSPVRIIRDENFEANIKGIIPCGEGAGYAGGITSAATDGIKAAEKVIMKYKPEYPYIEEGDKMNDSFMFEMMMAGMFMDDDMF